jgi:hypothetical protein
MYIVQAATYLFELFWVTNLHIRTWSINKNGYARGCSRPVQSEYKEFSHLGTFSRPCAPLVMIDEETFVHALLGNFLLFFLVLSLNFLIKKST